MKHIFFSFKKSFLPVLGFMLVFSSCHQKKNSTDTEINIKKEKKPGDRMTDFLGAMEYEFNMLKDPVTGRIPEGIREAELAQASAIYARQMERQNLLGRPMTTNPYSFQGPDNLGGRTRAIAYDVRYNGSSNRIILAGGVSGGVYKSTDNGATWTRKSPTGAHYSCTSIAQDPRAGNQDTWYYGVGEASGNSASGSGAFYSGNGVYKSTDNGETWTITSLNSTALETFSTAADIVNKVIVNPTNGDVYAACAATIYRSTNGGTSWSVVLSGTLANSGQYTDIVVTSTGRLYAAFGGTNSSTVDGVWVSNTGNSGDWTRIAGAGAGGSPTGWDAESTYGRVVLAIAPSLESRVYALYYSGDSPGCPTSVGEGEMFYWNDVTSTWTDISATLPNESGCLSGNDPFAVQGGYDLVVAVKPDDAATVFIGGTNIYRSTNTGASWTRIGGYASPADYAIYSGSHPDIHSIVFQPTSTTTMLCGNDGGIQRTTDNLAATVSWTPINSGYRTYQYYYVDIDPRTSNSKVLGGAQDNGSTRNIGGSGDDFEMVYGGDGVSVGLSDPAVSGGTQYEYVGSQRGYCNRRSSALGLGFVTPITPTGESGTGLFVTLFKLDADNSEYLYYANDNALYRTATASTVSSGTWTSLTGVASSVGAANDITALATSRGTYSAATSSLFIGTSNGRVYRLNDPISVAAGTSPVDITGAGFPAGNISSIAVNPRNDDTIMVTFSNYGITGNVWWTGNANSATPTWTNVEGTLTLPSFRSCAIHFIPGSPEVQYYVGTSVGLYRSGTGFPGTPGWAQEAASTLGNAVVTSLALRPADGNLLVGTHGYGMWKGLLSLFPLPTELTAFTGKLQGKNALLEWETAFENNSKHFELEKSTDGERFYKIATLPAAGNSAVTRNYQYLDREPLTEFNYYRLRSVDIDNGAKLSNVVLLKMNGAAQDMIVMGNPVRDQIRIKFIKQPLQKGNEIHITDLSGKLVLRKTIAQGEQQLTINLPSGIAAGTYIIEAFVDGVKVSKKISKQ